MQTQMNQEIAWKFSTTLPSGSWTLHHVESVSVQSLLKENMSCQVQAWAGRGVILQLLSTNRAACQ